MKKWGLIYCIIYVSTAFGQEALLILDPENYLLGKIENGQVFTGPEEISLSIRGNSIFQGSTAETDSLLMLVDCKDIFSRKAGLVFMRDGKTVRYITRKGALFLGDHPIDEVHERLLDAQWQKDSSLLITHGIYGDTLATLTGGLHSSVEWIAAFLLITRYYHLEDDLKEHLTMISQEGDNGEDAFMYPSIPQASDFFWRYDGEKLTKVIQGRVVDEYIFDGKRIRSSLRQGLQGEWVWDGQILKPAWNPDPEQQWVWNDNILKPFWSSQPDLMWTYEDGIMRPMWDSNLQRQWVIEGNLPLPLIALIALQITP